MIKMHLGNATLVRECLRRASGSINKSYINLHISIWRIMQRKANNVERVWMHKIRFVLMLYFVVYCHLTNDHRLDSYTALSLAE